MSEMGMEGSTSPLDSTYLHLSHHQFSDMHALRNAAVISNIFITSTSASWNPDAATCMIYYQTTTTHRVYYVVSCSQQKKAPYHRSIDPFRGIYGCHSFFLQGLQHPEKHITLEPFAFRYLCRRETSCVYGKSSSPSHASFFGIARLKSIQIPCGVGKIFFARSRQDKRHICVMRGI
ncbi:hypothetical protein HBI64_082780 [Parastagonospora nodorum]|nr:hypothetical protein HBI64_082780 [Parastagonospora nodorum]